MRGFLATFMPLLLLAVIFCRGFSPAISDAATQMQTLTPAADTTTKAASPNKNFGTTTSLTILNNPSQEAYLTFDLSSLAGKQITKATLALSVTNASTNIFELHQVTDTTWNETTLTYTNRPAITNTVLASFTKTKTGTVSIDLTSFIIQNQGKTVSLAITSPSGTDTLVVKSKEATSGKPTLSISLASQPTATPTAQPTFIPTNTVTPSPTPTQNSYTVVDEGLAAGWQDWSWNSITNFTDLTFPYTGTKTLTWQPTAPYAGLLIHSDTGINTINYTAFRFALRATTTGQKVGVQLYDANNQGIGTMVTLDKYGGDPVPGSYTVYTIPLADLGGMNTAIHDFHIMDITGQTQPIMYIDAVQFIGTGETPMPSASPTITPTAVPSITPTPTISPSPTPSQNLPIYTDTLATGWQDWSWDSTINFANTTPVATGTDSIKDTANAPWSGMDIHNPTGVSTSPYDTLHFMLQAGQANSQYAVYLEDSTGKTLTTPISLSSFGSNPVPGSWITYNVPLSTLNGMNTTITGIVLHDISGTSSSTVYIDDLSLQQTNSTPVITAGVPNNSVEQVSQTNGLPVGWTESSWGTNTPVYTYLSTGHTGNHSIQVQLTSYTSGDAKWMYDPQPATPNKKYLFTDYYESTVPSIVVVQFQLSDGTYQYTQLKPTPAANTWTKYENGFTAPANAVNLTVEHLLNNVGTLTTDDYSVTDYVPDGFNQGIVTITWDDGVASQYTDAFPLMQKYNIPGTFYVISSFLNTDFYMTASQAATLQQAGEELGDHTYSHPDLTTLTSDQLQLQLDQSQKDLQGMFGTSFDNFASPYGLYNDQIMAVIKQYYRSHRSVEVGYNSKDNFNPYDIVIQEVYTSTTSAQVEAWVDQAKKDHTWLVLLYHQVDNASDGYSVTSQDLDTELQYIKNSGLPVQTMEQALNTVEAQMQ